MSPRSAEPPVARSKDSALLRLSLPPTWAVFVFPQPKELA
jgi:hypothetical protein